MTRTQSSGEPIGPHRRALLAACLLVAAVSVPLILRFVGPNSIYGFRTRFTLSSEEIWYPANAFAGAVLLIAAAISGTVIWFLPATAPKWVGVLAFLGPLATAFAASVLYLGRLG